MNAAHGNDNSQSIRHELQRVWTQYIASERKSRVTARQFEWPKVLDAIYEAWTTHDMSFSQIGRSMGLGPERIGDALREAFACRERKSVQRAYEAGRSSVIPMRRSA